MAEQGQTGKTNPPSTPSGDAAKHRVPANILLFMKIMKYDNYLWAAIFVLRLAVHALDLIQAAALVLNLLYWNITEAVSRKDKTHDKDAPKDKGNSLRVMVTLILAQRMSALLGVVFPDSPKDQPYPFVVRASLLVVMVAALGLRHWSMSHLGKFFTSTLRIVDKQKIVTDGPYTYIRHPGYLANFVLVAAFGFSVAPLRLLPWWPLATFVAMWIVYYERTSLEEEMMIDQVGPEYEEYRKRTWRLFPLIW